MINRRLILITGIPGAGKSTAAAHIVKRWGATVLESDQFVDHTMMTSTGDFTESALASSYQAMSRAVRESLQTDRLVVAVGSFRELRQRDLVRHAAQSIDVPALTLGVIAPVETATSRVEKRGRGPDAQAIALIGSVLSEAKDIDVRISNFGTRQRLYGEIESLMDPIIWALNAPDLPTSTLVEYFETRAAQELSSAHLALEPQRLRTWPPDRVTKLLRGGLPADARATIVPNAPLRCRVDVSASYISAAKQLLTDAGLRVTQDGDNLTVFTPALTPSARAEIAEAAERELHRARDRIREIRNYLLLACARPDDTQIDAVLQKATDKWINAVDRLGTATLFDIAG